MDRECGKASPAHGTQRNDGNLPSKGKSPLGLVNHLDGFANTIRH